MTLQIKTTKCEKCGGMNIHPAGPLDGTGYSTCLQCRTSDNPNCEGCGATIKRADPHQYNAVHIEYLCENCAHTWQNFKDEPESFYFEDEYGDAIYYTAETAEIRIAKHLANGGKLTDKFALITPESSQRTLNDAPASEAQALHNKDVGAL